VSKITHIKVLGLALFAVFAFSMVAAAMASAHEWLFNGLTFAGELETNTEGTLELLILTSTTLLNTIDCSALFLGDVTGGAGGINLVLDVNTLPPNSVIEELPGTSLTCETLQGVAGLCEVGAGKESLLWVDELRLTVGSELTWETLIELDGAVFLDHFHHVAFELSCITAAGKLEALCEGLTSGLLENVATGVLIEFSEAAGVGSEQLTCLDGTEEFTVAIDANLIIKHATSDLLLSVS
jgi:hypothetical protein